MKSIGVAMILILSGAAAAQTPAAGDAVLQTLAAGEAARGQGDYAALLRAGQALRLLGAHPAEGDVDLAAQWVREATDHGATLPSDATYRGAALGPAYKRGALAGRGSFSVKQLFLAGQTARIAVAPVDGGAALSVSVKGMDGATLCTKSIVGQGAECAWMPVFTDRYAITIENEGTRPAAFFLTMK